MMDSKEGRFKCDECDNGVNYSRRYNLEQHKASRHHNVTFDCDECDKSYTSKKRLKSIRNHSMRDFHLTNVTNATTDATLAT